MHHRRCQLWALAMASGLIASSQLVDAAQELPNLTFFEYLAEMVETEEGWIDPLELEEDMADLDLLESSTDTDSAGAVEEVTND